MNSATAIISVATNEFSKCNEFRFLYFMLLLTLYKYSNYTSMY